MTRPSTKRLRSHGLLMPKLGGGNWELGSGSTSGLNPATATCQTGALGSHSVNLPAGGADSQQSCLPAYRHPPTASVLPKKAMPPVKSRQTQRQRLRELFEQREGEWIPLPEILSMNIAQFRAQLKELRDIERMHIENKMEHEEGTVRSWYRYLKPKTQKTLFVDQPETVRPQEHALEADLK